MTSDTPQIGCHATDDPCVCCSCSREEISRQQGEIESLKKERDSAIAHDRQPYPTADAYDKACKALHAKERRIKELEKELAITRAAKDLNGLSANGLWAQRKQLKARIEELEKALETIGSARLIPGDSIYANGSEVFRMVEKLVSVAKEALSKSVPSGDDKK